MRQNDFELRVLVGGKPIHEYEHQGNVFVEGRRGSEFELEFRNNTAKRVLAVPSVDGLSVMDGKPATPDSMGYLVPAHGVVKIPGWRLDANGVAKFVFEDKDRSYARTANSQSGPRAGVVGMLVFDEKEQVQPITKTIYQPYPVYQPSYPTWNPCWGGGTASPAWPQTWTSYTASSISNTMGAVSNSAVGAAHMALNNATQAVTGQVSEPELKTRRVDKSEKPFEMGTGFGQKTDFKTNEVQFDKGNQTATLVVYYDSRRNLEKRGIQVVRQQRTYLEDLPSPFQSSGCTPPPGWNG